LFACRRLKLDLYLSSYTKINSQKIKDVDIRCETLKLLRDIGKILEDIGTGNYFLNRASVAHRIRARIVKLKSFCTSGDNHRMGEDLHSYSTDKGLIAENTKS
jgi:hypothetical protein